MSDYKKRKWLENVTIIVDSREKSNEHITNELDRLGVKWCIKKLDFGDYSFNVYGEDFLNKCVIERKSGVLELYGNTIERKADPKTGRWMNVGGRLEAEIERAKKHKAQLSILIEGVESMREVKNTALSKEQIKKFKNIKTSDIGKRVYSWLRKREQNNSGGFRIIFANPKETAAARIMEEFYYFTTNHFYNLKK